MSWSVSLIGTPKKVVEALEAVNSGLEGQSRDEWGAAKPHISALVAQTFTTDEYIGMYPGYRAPLVKLDASGSCTTRNGKLVEGSCSVTIELLWSALC